MANHPKLYHRKPSKGHNDCRISIQHFKIYAITSIFIAKLETWCFGILSVSTSFTMTLRNIGLHSLYIIPCINNIRAGKGIHGINFGLTG